MNIDKTLPERVPRLWEQANNISSDEMWVWTSEHYFQELLPAFTFHNKQGWIQEIKKKKTELCDKLVDN